VQFVSAPAALLELLVLLHHHLDCPALPGTLSHAFSYFVLLLLSEGVSRDWCSRPITTMGGLLQNAYRRHHGEKLLSVIGFKLALLLDSTG
jgi:hypothetical protein